MHDLRDTCAMLYQLSYETSTSFQKGFKAQLVEHRTGITDVMGSNPVQTSVFFW